jgi:hypothetical protein
MARTGAYENLTKPHIKEAIQKRKEQIQLLIEVSTVEELAERWTEEIRFDIAELVDEYGTFKNPKDLPPKVRRLIQGVKIKESIVEEEGGSRTVLNRWMEYKLPDRQKAKIELGKRIGFYPGEKVEYSGAVPPPLQLTDADRALMRQMIDMSAKKLVNIEREAILPELVPWVELAENCANERRRAGIAL